jgi:hypothetical protein
MKARDREYFYKYVTADVAKTILETLKVKLSSPLLFNDPFDSQLEINHNATDANEAIAHATKAACNLLQPLLKDGDVEAAHQVAIKELLKDRNFVSSQFDKLKSNFEEINKIVTDFLEDDRVFCVSEKHDNLLMWAHYTDEHKGAVIRFRCMPELETALCAAKPVLYRETMPVLDITEMLQNNWQHNTRKILDEILLTKSLDWEYEQEWRVILNKTGDGLFDLRSVFEQEIDAIYLGCRMEPENRNEIISLVKNRRQHMRIFSAHKDAREFKLNFKEIICEN